MRVGNEDVTTDDQRLAKLKAGHWRIIMAVIYATEEPFRIRSAKLNCFAAMSGEVADFLLDE